MALLLFARTTATASSGVLPDLNERLHPSDSTPWTILFALTLITLLPAILMCMPPGAAARCVPLPSTGTRNPDSSLQSNPSRLGSTPLKILLFVMVDGWNLLARSLLKSF